MKENTILLKPSNVVEIKIGLTLSGGGVRASVFHLGLLARLADENLLEKTSMLSTVSGGSLIAGLVYKANDYKWPNSAEFKNKKIISDVKNKLTKKNLLLRAIGRMIFWLFPMLTKGRAIIFSGAMRNAWGIKENLNQIPSENPRWNINGTAIESGKSWRYLPGKRMGDYELNYVLNPDIPLSEALCSSAAVPFAIGPYKLHTGRYKWVKYDVQQQPSIPVEPVFKTLHIWDGGAYDNLGLEALVKFNKGIEYREEINFLLVSDAAMALSTEKRKWYNPMRLIDVTMDQVRALRARIMADNFITNKNTGCYVKIGDSIASIKKRWNPSYQSNISSTGISDAQIAEAKNYPTTLWKMKPKDFDIIFKHGWEAANASLVMQCPDLFTNQNYTY